MGTGNQERYARVFMSVVAEESLEATETQPAARAAPAPSVPRPVTLPPVEIPIEQRESSLHLDESA